MKKNIAVGVIILFLLVVGGLSITAISNQGLEELNSGEVIGVIEINGMITGSSYSSFLQTDTVSSRNLMDIIRQARDRQDLKAIVLRIDSPGGTSVASQEIALELDKFRTEGIPVIVSMGDVCASGGYWIACSSDYIMANGATLTGSIGVIMELQNLEGLYDKLGIRQVVVKSGEYKDIGSSFRDMAPEEQQMLQDLVDESYEQFLQQVLRGRKDHISREELVKIADGRILSGIQAQKLGLVDDLGNYYDALDKAREIAGITGEPRVEVLNSQTLWEKVRADLSASMLLNNRSFMRMSY